jgi:phage I-like protein
MLQQLQESELKQQAEKQGVPVEVLKRQQELENRIKQQEEQFQQLQYQAWQRRIDSEKSALKADFPMLSDEDFQKSIEHMLTVVRNPDVSLEESVYAVHGKKIAQALKEQAEQDALAKISGRIKSPLAPQGGKSNPTVSLTAEEKYVARQMGISETDYLKYKTNN